ncbi:MAG: DinB family protein [Flavobacteriales bacterium]
MEENKSSEYFNYYISRVKNKPLVNCLSDQKLNVLDFLRRIAPVKYDYAYAEGKWSVKELLFHIVETELIMLYRAIRVSKGDQTSLPGYDEDFMVNQTRVSDMKFEELIALFERARGNTLFYYSHFNQEELDRVGFFSDLSLDVKGLGYLMAGHADHHIEVLKEKYL